MTDDQIDELAFLEKKRALLNSVNRVKRRQARETRKDRALELLSWAAAIMFFTGLGVLISTLWRVLS